MTDNFKGAMLMMASMAAFTLNDACMKALSDELPLFQALFLRGLMTSGLMVLLALYLRQLHFGFSRRDWQLVLLRSVCDVGAAYFFISALFNMPLANATAILQALPLTVTLAGAVFLGEAIGWRRISAILIGFVGVLMIVQPGTDDFNRYSIYVVIAVLFVTARDLAARKLSKDVPSVTAALFVAVSITGFSAVMTQFETWAVPSRDAIIQLVAAAIFIVGAYLFSVMTMRVGDIASVTPFRYTSLLWALVLGFLIFGDWPNALTLAGAALVVATGVFTLLRERRVAKLGSQR